MRAEVALIIFFSSNTSHVQQITATVALNVIYKAGNAKLIIFPYTQPGEAGYLWRAWVKKKNPEQLTQVIRYFLLGRSGTWGLHTSHTSGHDHSATSSPSQARPCHIWPRRPGTFSYPLFKMHQWFPFNTCSP